jgi:hypothetical protein
MKETRHFLANMIVLEEETAAHCKRLAQVALDAGDDELEAFFQSLVETAQLDVTGALADGIERRHATFKPTPVSECLLAGPARQMRTGYSALLGVHCAVSCALALVRRNHGYYASIGASAKDAGLRSCASGFERERAGHISALEHWILRLTT